MEKLIVTITLEADVAALGELLAETADDLRRLGLRMKEMQAGKTSRPSPTHPHPASPIKGEEEGAGRRCEQCGTPLLKRPTESRAVFATRRYCGHACAAKARIAPHAPPFGKGDDQRKSPWDGRTCPQCGKPIERKRYARGQLEQSSQFLKRRFCDSSCAQRYRLAQREVKSKPAPIPKPLPDPREISDYKHYEMRAEAGAKTCPKHGDILRYDGACPTCNAVEKRKAAEREGMRPGPETRSSRGIYE